MVATFFSIFLRRVYSISRIVGVMFLLLLCTHMASTRGRGGGTRRSSHGGRSQLSRGGGGGKWDGTRDYFLAIGATVGFIGAFIIIYICICMCIKDRNRE